MKRFGWDLYKHLRTDALGKFPNIKQVLDIGFLRVDLDKLAVVYLLCVYADSHLGFVRYNKKEEDWEFDSMYYMIDPALEVRFDKDGKHICKYVSIYDEKAGLLTVSKIKDDKLAEEYKIFDNKKDLQELCYKLSLNNIIEADDTYFKTFKSGDKLYLFIE